MINKLWQIVNIYLENRWFWKKTILTLVFFQQCFFSKKNMFFFKKTEHVFFQENTKYTVYFVYCIIYSIDWYTYVIDSNNL